MQTKNCGALCNQWSDQFIEMIIGRGFLGYQNQIAFADCLRRNMHMRSHSKITFVADNSQTLGFHDFKVGSKHHVHLLSFLAEFSPVITAQGPNTDHPNFHAIIGWGGKKKRPIRGAVKNRTFLLDSDSFLGCL